MSYYCTRCSRSFDIHTLSENVDEDSFSLDELVADALEDYSFSSGDVDSGVSFSENIGVAYVTIVSETTIKCPGRVCEDACSCHEEGKVDDEECECHEGCDCDCSGCSGEFDVFVEIEAEVHVRMDTWSLERVDECTYCGLQDANSEPTVSVISTIEEDEEALLDQFLQVSLEDDLQEREKKKKELKREYDQLLSTLKAKSNTRVPVRSLYHATTVENRQKIDAQKKLAAFASQDKYHASPIHNQFAGVYFGVTHWSGGVEPSTSPYGNQQIRIPAEELITKDTCLFYASNHQIKANKYVRLVLVHKSDKEALNWCCQELLELDKSKDIILQIGQQTVSHGNFDRLWIELFYAGPVDLKKVKSSWHTVKSTGRYK